MPQANRLQGLARLLTLPVIVVGVVMGSNASAAVVLIDDFTASSFPFQWPVVLTSPGQQTISESSLGPTVIGGARTTTVGAQVPGSGSGYALAAIGAGMFDFVSNSSTQGAVQFLYDGGGALGLNLAQHQSIDIDFALFDASGGPMGVTVTMNDGVNAASFTQMLAAAGPQAVQFDLANFTGISSLDLTAISSIAVDLAPGIGADFRVSRISTTIIPAPAALALLGIAAAIGGRRRRRS